MKPKGREKPQEKPPRSLKRRVVGYAALLAIVIVSYLLLTRSFIVRNLAMAALSSATGTTASCASVVASASGEIVIEGLVLESEEAKGPASRVFEASKIRIDAAMLSLLTNTPEIRSIEFDTPVLRVSQSLKTERLNLPKISGTTQAAKPVYPTRLPKISVRSGTIELGEHDLPGSVEGYRALKHIDVDGFVGATDGTNGASVITFHNISAAGGDLEVRATFTGEAVGVKIGDIDLGKVDLASLPKPVREVVSELKLTGLITGVEFTYGLDGEFSANAQLINGGATLPREVQPIDDDKGGLIPPPAELAGRKMRMTGMNGAVSLRDGRWSGTLKAMAEDLPCEVFVEWMGTDIEAPFTAKLRIPTFEMRASPFIVQFADPVAKLRYSQFGDPTGKVTGEINFARAERDQPITISGALDLEQASTAFHKFPYRFSNIRGRVSFTEKAVTIEKLEGDSPSGAKVSATGTLIPPDNPVADIRVKVANIKTDEALLEAMRTRGRIMEELFSRRAYRDLLDAGLVRAPGTRGDAPVFEPGGVANLEVLVTREPLADGEGEWHDTVTVNFPKVGILPDDFPYPMIGHDVTLVKHDYDATISGGYYEGLAGGRAEITAKADLLKIDDPQAEFIPEVSVVAAALPIDERLIRALPPGREALGDGRTVPEIVRAFGFGGAIGGQVTLGMTPTNDMIYDVNLAFRDVDARPVSKDTRGIELRDITGTLKLNQDRLETDLRADVIKTDTGMLPFTPAGDLDLDARFDFSKPSQQSRLTLKLDAKRLDLMTPVEDAVRVVSPEAADSIAQLRAEHAPAGTTDLDFTLTRLGGSTAYMRARAKNAAAQFALFGAKIGVNTSQGAASFIRDRSMTVYEFDALQTSLADITKFGVIDCGSWSLSGRLDDNGRSIDVFQAAASNARLDSPFLAALIDHASPNTAKAIRPLAPAGIVDGSVRIEGQQINGQITPRTLAATINGGRASFDSCTGTIDFGDLGAGFSDLHLNAKDWNVVLRGNVIAAPDGNVNRNLVLNVQATGLPAELRNCLPGELRESIDSIDLTIDGPLGIRDLLLNWSTDAQGIDRIAGRASIDFDRASADVGATLTQCSGKLETSIQVIGENPPRFTVDASNITARVSGLSVANAAARITDGIDAGRPGAVLISAMSADSHGGRITGRASLEPADSRGKRRFDAELQLADLRFADVLKDYRNVSGDAQAQEAQPDAARGMLDANMTITGEAGNIASRRGRGLVTISDGQVLSVPLLVSLVRVSNLQLPRSETMNFASVEFFIEGAGVNVEQLAVESPSVGIYGFGTASWPDLNLDLRFRTRARNRIPVVTDVIEGIKGEIVTGVVRGAASDPDISVTALTGTSKLIDRILGRDPGEQEKRLEQIEKSRQDAAAREREKNEPTAPK